jgi:hypothetical protein
MIVWEATRLRTRRRVRETARTVPIRNVQAVKSKDPGRMVRPRRALK